MTAISLSPASAASICRRTRRKVSRGKFCAHHLQGAGSGHRRHRAAIAFLQQRPPRRHARFRASEPISTAMPWLPKRAVSPPTTTVPMPSPSISLPRASPSPSPICARGPLRPDRQGRRTRHRGVPRNRRRRCRGRQGLAARQVVWRPCGSDRMRRAGHLRRLVAQLCISPPMAASSRSMTMRSPLSCPANLPPTTSAPAP